MAQAFSFLMLTLNIVKINYHFELKNKNNNFVTLLNYGSFFWILVKNNQKTIVKYDLGKYERQICGQYVESKFILLLKRKKLTSEIQTW